MTENREPSGWELQRFFEQLRTDIRDGNAGISQRIDKLVTQEAFQAEQRRVDERLRELREDIADEKGHRATGDEGQQTAIDKLTANLRWLAAAVLLPVGLFIANLLSNR